MHLVRQMILVTPWKGTETMYGWIRTKLEAFLRHKVTSPLEDVLPYKQEGTMYLGQPREGTHLEGKFLLSCSS
jgi:hypothetical protein